MCICESVCAVKSNTSNSRLVWGASALPPTLFKASVMESLDEVRDTDIGDLY